MEGILRNWRIPAATLFSMAFIVGAYLLAKNIERPPSAQASAETALLQAIATKDSDSDGLTDWEEQLYGTDPQKADTRNLGMTDGEAVAKGLIIPKAIADIAAPATALSTQTDVDYAAHGLPQPPAEGTLTAVFAKNFFTIYLNVRSANGGNDLSESQLADVQKQTLDSLTSAIVTSPNFKSARDLTVAGSGPTALKAFAVAAEAVLLANKADASKSEIAYLTDAVQNNDATALDNIASIAKAYRSAAAGLAQLSAPIELAADILAFINALARLSEIDSDFTRVNSDPLAAILALGLYPSAVQSLATAFGRINTIYTNAGVLLSVGEPGAAFVNLISNIAAKQAAADKKK